MPLVPSLVPSVTGFSFIRFSGFLWVIDGPTNAVAIDPLIVVMVPGYSEWSYFGNDFGFGYEVSCFFGYFSFSIKVETWV